MLKIYENRLLFLKQFTKELILQSKLPEASMKNESIREIGNGEFIPSVPLTAETPPEFLKQQEKKPVMTKEIKMPLRLAEIQRHRVKIVKPLNPRAVPNLRVVTGGRGSKEQTEPTQEYQQSITAQPQIKEGRGIDLGKLNFLASDPRVAVIECQGSEKPVLVRIAGQTQTTKISLNKEEIKKIVEKFSEESKIPIIPGLFKAAVGNLIITAVISDLIGSRFIITKITPSFMLESGALR